MRVRRSRRALSDVRCCVAICSLRASKVVVALGMQETVSSSPQDARRHLDEVVATNPGRYGARDQLVVARLRNELARTALGRTAALADAHAWRLDLLRRVSKRASEVVTRDLDLVPTLGRAERKFVRQTVVALVGVDDRDTGHDGGVVGDKEVRLRSHLTARKPTLIVRLQFVHGSLHRQVLSNTWNRADHDLLVVPADVLEPEAKRTGESVGEHSAQRQILHLVLRAIVQATTGAAGLSERRTRIFRIRDAVDLALKRGTAACDRNAARVAAERVHITKVAEHRTRNSHNIATLGAYGEVLDNVGLNGDLAISAKSIDNRVHVADKRLG
mmetsp:Transcript_134503/g.326886  ORF Transcript_134503/g.326886 Transcript_134503/m.326886 type:complete len:330 (+) Transcript_134503:3588-4577(+)